ncbi:Rab GTPase-interacting Golgi membrane protein [Ordospora colligata]|uniref:Rab GTPase-interacting Golgi membrane protein n=1 Tax=Ordospora colligata OC4 TaxID=1354746 RepID=A0A0B2UMC9_9MICR|nr:Rab GTPase-interacting Golgi membrane protein [Ordospora colligata OC4]KHN70125.1 Rab GTPase-interacting Golgi membrane protein [Ordospora colligata OC4]TBU16507.1 Rab GTPase-interacting Golgi membrane protein [Ordospora colligata]TBU16692.1 Rab GTPase-interacting Golgi membrane protein [Ordospora colligata]TBU19265.1 Rab GTPase-interacting Golgi membrane protein [Ordospora colligata]
MNFDVDGEEYSKFDLKSAFIGWLPNDRPLLEELGIDFGTIKKESRLIFKVMQKTDVDFSFVKDADLSGPIVFVGLYCLGLVMNYRIHFGYVYFISLLMTFSMYFLLNVLDTKRVGFLECCSVLGYSFLPIVLFSITSVLMRGSGTGLRMCCGFAAALWSSYTASVVFCRYLSLNNKQVVVGYPLLMGYMGFVMVVIF